MCACDLSDVRPVKTSTNHTHLKIADLGSVSEVEKIARRLSLSPPHQTFESNTWQFFVIVKKMT